MMRSYRGGQRPFESAVRPTGGAAQIFIEEWERGFGKAGGSYAGLNGLYGLPPRWTHILPAGGVSPFAAPAISAAQQMLWLGLAPQADDDTVDFRWNAAIARMPARPVGDFAYQVDACYTLGVNTDALTDPPPLVPKPGAIGIIMGGDTLLAAGWLGEFYFSATETQFGENETAPEIWDDAQTLNEASAAQTEGVGKTYVTVLVSRAGGVTSYITFSSCDGVSKIQVGAQTSEVAPTCIGFAVRTERPAADDLGLGASGWCEYIRMRPLAAGGLGAVQFGQTGGRTW